MDNKQPDNTSHLKGKLVESIVARMHAASGVKVETNVRLPPKGSEVPGNQWPEIDVLLTAGVAGYPVRIAIECKNYDEPVEKAKIDEFIGKLDDVGIPKQHGIFVSVSGYTQGAIRRAQKEGIQTLILRGLTEDRLASAIQEAFQSRIYVLAVLTAISIKAEVSTEQSEQLLAFFDEQRQLVGFVPDLVWSQWLNGFPSSQLGKYDYELEIPSAWYHLVDGEFVPISKVWVTVEVRGLVVDFPGKSIQHALVDAVQEKATKALTDVVFDFAELRYPVTTLFSEAELQEFLSNRKGAVGVTIGRFRIPRILRPPMFWPPSQRIIDRFEELASAYAAGKIGDPKQVDLSEIEGDDLAAAWEPIWPEHPFLEGRTGLDALTRAITILENGPAKAKAYTNRGTILASQGNFVDAISDYTEAIALSARGPDQAMVYSNRAKAYHAHGDIHSAVEDYSRAIPQFSDDLDKAKAHTERGHLYYEMHDLKKALSDHNRALDLDAECAVAYINRGNVESDLGQAEEAIADYTQSICLLPDDPSKAIAYSNRGTVHEARGCLDAALSDYEQAIDLDRRCSKAFNNRGNLYFEKGDFQRAIRDYNEAIKLDPGYQVPYFNRGIMRAQLGEHQAAIVDYSQAIELNPEYAEAYVQRGLAWLEQGNQGLAIADMDQAIALFNDSTDKAKAYNNRGLAQTAQGDHLMAIEDYTQALLLTSDAWLRAHLLYNAARAYALLGEVGEACSCLEQAIALNADWQELARSQVDFGNIAGHPRFQDIVGEASSPHND